MLPFLPFRTSLHISLKQSGMSAIFKCRPLFASNFYKTMQKSKTAVTTKKTRAVSTVIWLIALLSSVVSLSSSAKLCRINLSKT